MRIHGHGIYEIWHRQSKNKKGTIKSQNQWDINGKSMGNQLENQWGINGKSIERQSLKYNGKSMGSKKWSYGIERFFLENIYQGDLTGHIFNHLISKGVSENGVSPPAIASLIKNMMNPWISEYIIFRQTHLGGSKLLAKNTWIHETEKTHRNMDQTNT